MANIETYIGKRKDMHNQNKKNKNEDNGHSEIKKIKGSVYFPSLYCDNITTKYTCTNTCKDYQLKICGACKHKYYCSEKCQRYHWKKYHRLECARIQERFAGKCGRFFF